MAEENRHRWLAGQIDEVEDKLLTAVVELSTTVRTLTSELATTREQMTRSSQRIVWTVFAASVTLLISVLGFIISNAIGGGG